VIPPSRSARERGFTLTEIAIVFMIVALLIGGTVLTLSAQNEARELSDAQRTLEQAREAITGFAVRNGRLPCPALGGAANPPVEGFCTNAAGACGAVIFVPPGVAPAHGRCASPNGFVPSGALGIGPIETNAASPNFGLALDSWLQPIRYSVSQVLAPAPSPPNTMLFTAAGEMRNHLLTAPPAAPDLLVCTASAGAVPATPACGPGVPGFQTPAVVYSTGKNFPQQLPLAVAGGPDEQDNIHFGAAIDRIFVAHEGRPAGAPGGAFDDLVIWVSPNVLYNRLIAAGAL
jgi:type II secretory pathway pseudopilin PulG